MMCLCPHCHSALIPDATICLDCGTALDQPPRVPPPLPLVPGVKVQLITSRGQPIVIRPVKRLPVAQKQLSVQPVHPIAECSIDLWRDIGAPLIALAFVISFVLGVAAALDVVGVSLGGLALLAVPIAGALQAEASWLQGRWRVGLLSMLLWEGLLWTLVVGPLLA